MTFKFDALFQVEKCKISSKMFCISLLIKLHSMVYLVLKFLDDDKKYTTPLNFSEILSNILILN